MGKVLSAVLITALLLVSPKLHAQVCASGYDRPDRTVVKIQFSEIEPVLLRMAELAEMSTNGTLSHTQRSALENEFIALREEISRFGDELRPLASSRTNQFLSEVIDAEYLELNALTIQGSTTLEAQENSRTSLDGIVNALSKLMLCIWGSWERHNIELSKFDGRLCAGGYDRSDRILVTRKARGVKLILSKMAKLAQYSATQVLSSSQRLAAQFDFEFAREQLDILGSIYHPRASQRTNYFLNTLIDPGYLDLMQLQIDGATISESQANAKRALNSVNNALTTALTCFQYSGTPAKTTSKR